MNPETYHSPHWPPNPARTLRVVRLASPRALLDRRPQLRLPRQFNIAQLILIFRDRDFLHGTYVLTVNIYVEIISVLLATLRCSGTHCQGGVPAPDLAHEKALSSQDETIGSLSTATFAPPSNLASHVQSAV